MKTFNKLPKLTMHMCSVNFGSLLNVFIYNMIILGEVSCYFLRQVFMYISCFTLSFGLLDYSIFLESVFI